MPNTVNGNIVCAPLLLGTVMVTRMAYRCRWLSLLRVTVRRFEADGTLPYIRKPKTPERYENGRMVLATLRMAGGECHYYDGLLDEDIVMSLRHRFATVRLVNMAANEDVTRDTVAFAQYVMVNTRCYVASHRLNTIMMLPPLRHGGHHSGELLSAHACYDITIVTHHYPGQCCHHAVIRLAARLLLLLITTASNNGVVVCWIHAAGRWR